MHIIPIDIFWIDNKSFMVHRNDSFSLYPVFFSFFLTEDFLPWTSYNKDCWDAILQTLAFLVTICLFVCLIACFLYGCFIICQLNHTYRHFCPILINTLWPFDLMFPLGEAVVDVHVTPVATRHGFLRKFGPRVLGDVLRTAGSFLYLKLSFT